MYKYENLKEPYNPTDPIVVLDPSFKKTIVVKLFMDESNADLQPGERKQEKTDGINYPIIQINSQIIDEDKIKYFELRLYDFLPTLNLTITDYEHDMQYSNIPGLDNVITVIMTMPVDGIYKKVSIDFYITNCDFWTNDIVFSAIFKNVDLERKECRQIGTGKISTYTLLKEIAAETGLGFAATEDCESIKDEKYRQIYSIKLKDFVLHMLNNSGTSSKSIFNAWVDLHGYIILVNLAWLKENIPDPKQLTINSINTFRTTSNDEQDDIQLVPRILTNSAFDGQTTNIKIVNYNSIVNSDKIRNDGALCNYWYLTNPCDSNKLTCEQVQIIEDSIDGEENSDSYEFEHIEFLGTEMNGNNLYQTKVREKFINKWESKQLEIELESINIGLQRGTLVNIIIYDYDMEHKKTIMNNADNANATENTAEESDDAEINDPSLLTDNENIGFINPILSGVYYINKMKFVFSNGEFKHFLYVTKLGRQNNLYNKSTVTKINVIDNE